jgi:exosortase E/protease (VPEID-CTERM system)
LSLTIEPAIDDPRPRYHPYIRPIALTLLLFAEALLFSLRFETPAGFSTRIWWGSALANAYSIARLILLAPVVILTFGGLRLAVRLRRAFERDAEDHDSWTTWLLAHVIAVSGFAALTWGLFEGRLITSPHPGAWVSAWIGSAMVTGATWLATLLSPSSWLGILRRSGKPILMGSIVSLVAFELSQYANTFWDSMAGTTLVLVRSILNLVARGVICDPGRFTIGLDGFKIIVGYQCSGFEGIGMIVAFLGAYLWWSRDSLRWPRAYLLVPLAAATIWLLNAVRIASMVLIGAWASPSVALGGFHSQAGWIAFLGVSLGFVVLSKQPWFSAAHRAEVLADPAVSNPTVAYLGPFLAILATAMITSAFSSGFDVFYGLRVLTGGLALWYFRRGFAGSLRGCSWVGVAVGVVAFGLWVALEPASAGGPDALSSTVGALPRGQAWAWIALRVIGSVAIIPLAEELAFRGYLTRRLISIDFESVPLGRFTWASLLISSAAFGLLHGRWIAGVLVGVLYALALYRRGNLGDAVLAHAVTNLLIAITVLETGNWAMWA